MKKTIVSILIFFMMLFPSGVMASGYISTNTKTLTIEIGSSKTFTIVAYDAIGDVTIKSENTDIATVNKSFFETGLVGEKATKKQSIIVKGISLGTTKINLDVDGATFTGEELSSYDQVIVVNVVEKKVDTRSNNNKLKNLSIEGFDLVKVNDNNYSLIVSNSVSSIKVLAEVEDVKAKVSGDGIYDLKVGENTITVTVTAENGIKNNIKIKVTRKDGYYIDDLDDLLKNDDKNIDIILNKDMKITKENINDIKNSLKNVTFNYYDEDKKLSYSWIIDGSKINQSMEILTTLSNSPSDESIYEVVNYVDGKYINVMQEGNLPSGIKLRVNVSDKYSDGSSLNIYKYVNGRMELVSDNINVISGNLEFNVIEGTDYFITKANLNTVEDIVLPEINIYMIISILELIIIIILICVLIISKKKKKHSKKADELFMMENNVFPVKDMSIQSSNSIINNDTTDNIDFFPNDN